MSKSNIVISLVAPLGHPTIEGQQNGSVVSVEVGKSVRLNCRVSCIKPPFLLTWKMTLNSGQHILLWNVRR